MGKYSNDIAKLVKTHGTLSPYTLKQLKYTQREIEQAVKDGVIEWTRDGRLTTK
jgi:hypothetical protein